VQVEDAEDADAAFLGSSAMVGKVPQYVELLKFKVRLDAKMFCCCICCLMAD
jgi:hypothetical protein